MYPNFLYQYALELQREREKELLNLAEDERLVRNANSVKYSPFIRIPMLNLYERIVAIGRNLSQAKNVATVNAKAEPCSCASCGALQKQVC